MEEGCFGHFVQKTHSPFEHTSKVVLRLWDAPFGIRGHLSFISFIWWNCVKKLLMLKAFLPKPTNTNMTKQTWYYSSVSWLCLPITRASLWAGLLQCRFQIQATKFSYSKSETSYKSSLPGCNPRAQRAKHIVERRDQANLTNNIILMGTPEKLPLVRGLHFRPPGFSMGDALFHLFPNLKYIDRI